MYTYIYNYSLFGLVGTLAIWYELNADFQIGTKLEGTIG